MSQEEMFRNSFTSANTYFPSVENQLSDCVRPGRGQTGGAGDTHLPGRSISSAHTPKNVIKVCSITANEGLNVGPVWAVDLRTTGCWSTSREVSFSFKHRTNKEKLFTDQFSDDSGADGDSDTEM